MRIECFCLASSNASQQRTRYLALRRAIAASTGLFALLGTLAVLNPTAQANASEPLPTAQESPSRRQYQLECSIPGPFTDPSVYFPGLSVDGTLLAAYANTTLHIWNTETCEEVRTINSFAGTEVGQAPITAQISPDGRLIATGFYDLASERLRFEVWDIATGERVSHFTRDQKLSEQELENYRHYGDPEPEPTYRILVSLIWNSNSDRITSMVMDSGEITTWDAQSGQLLRLLSVNSGGSYTWSQDGQYFARTRDDLIFIWDLATSELRQVVQVSDAVLRQVSSSAALAEEIERSDVPRRMVWNVSFTPDSRGLFIVYPNLSEGSGAASVDIRRWDFATASASDRLFSTTDTAGALFLTLDGTTLVFFNGLGLYRIVDFPSGQTLLPYQAEAFPLYLVGINSDAKTLLFTNNDLSYEIWRSP